MTGKRSAISHAGGDAAPLVINLPADCRLAAQAAIKERCLAALAAGGVVLDGIGVERVDTAALQLLMLFQRDMAAGGGTWRWHGASPVLHEAASLLGLAQVLEMPATAPA